MYRRLRPLLVALTDEQGYKGAARLSWTILIFALAFLLSIYGGVAYAVWLFWPTLLLGDTFGGGFLSFLSTIGVPALVSMRLPLDLLRLQDMRASEPFSLALAVRHALATNGASDIAPEMSASSSEEGETSGADAFASAPTGMESLVAPVPALLITHAASPVALYCLGALLLGLAGMGVALAPTLLNIPLQELLSAHAGVVYLVTVCGSLTFLALLCILRGVSLSRRRKLQRRGVTVELDDIGLSFRQPVWRKRKRQIAWAEARALAQFTYKDNRSRPHLVYLLESDQQTLLWEEPPTERYASQPEQQRIASQQESARHLAQTITSRAGLSMRDLSDVMAALIGPTSLGTTANFLKNAYDTALASKDVETATALWRLREPGAWRQPRALRKLAAAASGIPSADLSPASPASLATNALTPHRSQFAARMEAMVAAHMGATIVAQLQQGRRQRLQVVRALIPYYPTERSADAPARFRRYLRRERQRRSLVWMIVWAELVLIVVTLLAYFPYSYARSSMDALTRSIPQQTQEQTPLYSASFLRPQGDWLVQKASKDAPTGAAFVDGGYQVSSADPNLSAPIWISRDEEGDIAIAVSVTIHGPITKNNYSPAGILFDVTGGGYAFSIFGVDERGNWSLWRYDSFRNFNDPWTMVAGGSNAAIHAGDGATNTLLLVRHGPLHLLYVNGTLAERFYDSDHALPPGGDVGVYLDSGLITAQFYDFAMYPVPPQLAAIPLTTHAPFWVTQP